jgi:stress-induced-phosphoprotein 1
MHGLGDLIGALDAYEEGLKLDKNNAQNQAGLASVKRAIDAEAKAGKFQKDGLQVIGTDIL